MKTLWQMIFMAPEDGAGVGVADAGVAPAGGSGAGAGTGAGAGSGAGAGAGDAGAGAGTGGTGAGTGDAAAGGDPAGDKGYWPDDWRDALVKDLPAEQKPKAQEFVKTRPSLNDIFRSALSADSKIQELSQNRVKLLTGKDDKPEEVAAYRKAFGIPDAPDKYAIPVTQPGVEPTAEETALWGAALPILHDANLGQKQLDAVGKALAVTTRIQHDAKMAIARKAGEAAQEDLRVEWGREYKANVESTNQFFVDEMRPFMRAQDGDLNQLLSRRFDDGTALGECVPFVRWLNHMRGELQGDGPPVVGQGSDGVDLDKQIDDITSLAHVDPQKYKSMQGKLTALVEAKSKRDSRKPRR
jgi:hypothetical protein